MDFTNVARFWKEDAVAMQAAQQSAERAVAGGEKQKTGTAQARDKQKAQMATQKMTPQKSDISYASEGYKPFPKDKVTRKVKALDAEKAMGLDGDTREKKAKNAKRRMKMDMAVYVDKDPELRGMHRSAKQTIEKNNRERGRKKMEEERRLQREYDKMWHNQKSDWRKDLTEAMKPGAEGAHPYVDVMPFVNQKAMEAKKQMKDAAKIEGGRQETNSMQEGKELSIDDQMRISREAAKSRNPNPDHKAIRGRMLAKAPKTRDSRTNAEKMADATGPRDAFGRPAKSGYRGD